MKVTFSKLLNKKEVEYIKHYLDNNTMKIIAKFPKGALATKIDKRLVIIDNCNGNNRIFI